VGTDTLPRIRSTAAARARLAKAVEQHPFPKLPRFCVFCGADPKHGNKEHVIPRWLIELTGDPKRKAIMAFDRFRQRATAFSFDQLQFPACKACNESFSRLEDEAKRVLQAIIAREAVAERDLSLFLDWLDKVRVGVWLAQLYLGSPLLNVQPKFHIASRMAVADRMAFFSFLSPRPGLTTIGVMSPMFMMMPSAFGMYINGVAILSVSTHGFLSRRIGFPYPVRRWALSGRGETQMQGPRDGSD